MAGKPDIKNVTGKKNREPVVTEDGFFQWSGKRVSIYELLRLIPVKQSSVIDQHTRMVECALITQEPERAVAAVHRCMEYLWEFDEERFTSDTPLAYIGGELSQRTCNLLESIGIITLDDLHRASEMEISEIAQIGEQTLQIFRDLLFRNSKLWESCDCEKCEEFRMRAESG